MRQFVSVGVLPADSVTAAPEGALLADGGAPGGPGELLAGTTGVPDLTLEHGPFVLHGGQPSLRPVVIVL